MMAEDQLDALVVPVVTDMQRFHREMDRLEKEGRRVGRQTGEAVGEGAAATRELTVSTEAATEAAKGLALIVASRVANGFKGALGWVTRTTSGLLDLGALGALSVSRSLDSMAESTRDANGELSAMGRAGKVAAGGLELAAKAAITVSGVITGMHVGAAALAGTLLILGHRASAAFGPSWNRVLVTVGEGGRAMDDLRRQVSLLAGELGVEGPAAADTFYEVLGSMPELLEDPAKAIEILRVSLEAGSTGFTNAAEAAKANAAVLSAFKLEADQARRVSDALFAAQGLGATTFGEIAASIGNVSGLTSALGGDFEDLLGIIATMTPTGTSTSEVVTQIGGAISDIIKPSEDAKKAAEELNVEFNAQQLAARGLNQFLIDMIEVTEGRPDLLARFFGGRQSLALMVALSDKTQELNRWTGEIKNSAGQTQAAVDRMNQSWERQKEILDARFTASLRALGDNFEGFGIRGLQAINGVLGALNDLDDKLAGGPGGLGRRGGEATRGFLERRLREIDDWLDAMFGSAASGQIPTLPGVTNRQPRVVFSPSPAAPPRSALPESPPIARPDEPTSLEFSQERIRAYTAELQALAVAEFARTRNMEAFEEATQSAQEAVNRLILSEAQRLRAAGAEEAVVNELLSMYRVLGERAGAASRVVEAAIARRTSAAERDIALLREEAAAAERVGRTDLAEKWSREADQLERLNRWAETFTPNVVKGVEGAAEVIGPSLSRLTTAFNDQMLQLREQLARGLIDPEEFERLGRESAERFNKGVLDKIDALRTAGRLTREEYQELIELLELLNRDDGAEDATREVQRLAREYGNVGRAVLSVVDSVDELDRAVRKSIEGTILLIENLVAVGAEVQDAMEKALEARAKARAAGRDEDEVAGIKGVLGIAGLTSVAGAVAGLVSIAAAFAGAADRQREAMLQSMESMRSLTQALRELRTAVLTDISVAEKERVQASGEAFLRRFGGPLDDLQRLGFGDNAATLKGLSQEDFDFLRGLEELTGVDFFDEKTGKVIADAFEEAWRIFQEMDVGDFANDLLGRLDSLDYAASVAGDAIGEAAQQMESFLGVVRRLAPEFAAEFERILAEQGTDAARAWLQRQAVVFAEGGADALGAWAANLTPAEIRRLIEEGLERTEPGGVTGGGSTRLNVSMTEVQGNTMLAHMATTNFLLSSIELSNRIMAGRAAAAPTFTPPSAQALGILPAGAAGTVIDLRGATFPFHFDGPPPAGLDEAAWGRIAAAHGRSISQQLSDIAAGAGIDRARVHIRGSR